MHREPEPDTDRNSDHKVNTNKIQQDAHLPLETQTQLIFHSKVNFQYDIYSTMSFSF